MSVSLEEALNCAGYDLNDISDARWLLDKQDEFEELIERAEELDELAIDYDEYVCERENEGIYEHMSFEEFVEENR